MYILSRTESFYFSVLVIVQCVFAHTDKTQGHSVFKIGEKAKPLYISFHCCGMCGTSIDEFMEGKDCPNISGRTLFFLKCSSDLYHFEEEKNSVMEFSRYTEIISKGLALNMQKEYLLLIEFTISEISKFFPTMDVWFFRHLFLTPVYSYRDMDYTERVSHSMSRLHTYEDLHEFLERQLCSWIYTEPLRIAIERLGTDASALTYYSSYEKKVAHFLKRSCFERFGYVHTDIVQHYREIVCNVFPRTIPLLEPELFEERLRRLLEVHFLMPRRCEMIVENESIVFRSVNDSKERLTTKSKLPQLGFETAVKSSCNPSLEVRVITAKEAVLSIFRRCWLNMRVR